MTESRFDPEEEAFNEIERQAKQRKESVKAQFENWRGSASDYERGVIDGMQKQMQSSVDKAVNSMQSDERKFLAGWNGALELAAFEIEHNFTKAFGKDTLQSIAVYIREMKK